MAEKSIAKNAAYNMLKTLSAIIFPLITIPYISRTLLEVGVGKVNFGASIISYFTLAAGLGISTHAIRECAKVKDNKEKLSKISSQLFSINILTTICSYVVLFFVLIFAKRLHEYRAVILIQSTAILFTTLGADWLNSAMEDFRYITIRTVSFQFVSMLLMFSFVHSPDDYLKYAAITVVSSSAANVVNIFYRKRYCVTCFTTKLELKKNIPPIIWMFSLLVSQIIFTNSDQTMLGLFRGDAEVGLYSTAVKIYNIVNTTIASIAFVVLPQMSYNFKQKNYKKINELFSKSFSFIAILGFPCVVGLFITADDVMRIIGGDAFAGAATALRILCVALLFSCFGGLIGNIINIPAGREKVSLIAAAVAAVTNVGLNLVLIPRYGLNGAAFTTAVAECIALSINVFNMDKRVRVGNISKIVLAPIVSVSFMAVSVFAVRTLIGNLYIRTVVELLIAMIVYFGGLMLMKYEFVIGIIEPLLNKIKCRIRRKSK